MIIHPTAHLIISPQVNTMKLLKIDNKLLALYPESATIYNITDNLANHNIRRIISNSHRFVILTSTNLFYLYHTKQNYILNDITENVSRVVNIRNIKFVVNGSNPMYNPNNIGIITDTNRVFMVNVEIDTIISCTHRLDFDSKNIMAVSSNYFGYIYANDNDEYVFENYASNSIVRHISTIKELPTQFIGPTRFLHDGNLMENNYFGDSVNTISSNIHLLYNYHYYTKNNKIYQVGYPENNCNVLGTHKTGDNIMIDFWNKHRIVLDSQTKTVDYINSTREYDVVLCRIARSYYHAESLFQYNNNDLINWSKDNHHMFDKYTNKLVEVVLKCHKYGSITKWIPKCVLYLIIQLIV